MNVVSLFFLSVSGHRVLRVKYYSEVGGEDSTLFYIILWHVVTLQADGNLCLRQKDDSVRMTNSG
jgi:hypothetical protein